MNKTSNGTLRINDYRVFGQHGWFEEEQLLGGEYSFDIEIKVIAENGFHDLTDTVDYESVCNTIKSCMNQRFKLIETMTQTTLLAIQKQIGDQAEITVTVTKLNVPVKGLHSTSFTLSA